MRGASGGKKQFKLVTKNKYTHVGKVRIVVDGTPAAYVEGYTIKNGKRVRVREKVVDLAPQGNMKRSKGK